MDEIEKKSVGTLDLSKPHEDQPPPLRHIEVRPSQEVRISSIPDGAIQQPTVPAPPLPSQVIADGLAQHSQVANVQNHPGMPNITIVNNNTQQSTPMIMVVQHKSMTTAMLLTFFFGPLGMLYSTVAGAIVMFLLALVALVLTAGIALLILWPFQLIWTYSAVNSHNANQLRRVA